MSEEYKYLKDHKAIRIYENVVASLGEFTNDSDQSKFFLLPDEVVNLCLLLAATLATVSYSPEFKIEETENLRVRAVYYIATVAGVQVFLKQRSIEKSFKPYKWNLDEKKIEEAAKSLIKNYEKNIEVPDVICEVIDEIEYRFKGSNNFKDFEAKGKKFRKKNYERYIGLSALWGYYFAKELVED